MLRRFLYLDEEALADYVSMVDGGELTESRRSTSQRRSRSVGADAKILKGELGRNQDEDTGQTFADRPAARFDRLVAAAADAPEELAWIEVLDPDTEFESASIGAMVSWECELEVPRASHIMSRKGGFATAIDSIEAIRPMAEALGMPMEGVPAQRELSALKGFVEGVGAKAVIVGYDEECDWRVSGVLEGDLDLQAFDGRAIIVGKVTRKLAPGEYKPFLTLPGLNVMSREQRRQAERKKPDARSDEDYLEGPALLLDILAIYR